MTRFIGVVEPRDGCVAPSHDSVSAYFRHCRCDGARVAYGRYRKRKRLGRQPAAVVDATGVHRRIEALAAMGWTLQHVAERIGVCRKVVCGWHVNATVYRSTRDRVQAAYNELAMTPGPSKATRALAVRRGFAPPLAWEGVDIDDPAAVPSLGVAWSTERGVPRCS